MNRPRDFPLLEIFMYFFNVWLVFIILHLGSKYVITDIISRFIHEPYAMAWLMLSVFLGLLGLCTNRRWPQMGYFRLVGNALSTFWWGTVWVLYLLYITQIISLAFTIYALPLVASITILTEVSRKVAAYRYERKVVTRSWVRHLVEEENQD